MRLNLAPIGQRRHSKGPRYREGTGTRPGPQGGTWEPSQPPVRPLHPTTHSAPLQGATGPAPLSGLLLEQCGWVYRYSPPHYPPGISTPGTPLVPVRRSHGSHVTAGTGTGATGACTYGCFWTSVGEPRGIRTQPYFRVRDRLYTVIYSY